MRAMFHSLFLALVLACQANALYYNYGKYADLSEQVSDEAEVDISTYIKNGNTYKVPTATRVTLPDGPDIESYAGFVTTDAEAGNKLFYWYFPARNGNVSAPLVIWLQGGPGGASTFGLFAENGPLEVNADMNVTLREETWNKDYKMLFIDNPVGAGFSYTSNNGYCGDTRDCVARNLYSMLTQFTACYNHVWASGIYITGESYGGKYVPAFANYIRAKNVANYPDDQIILHGIAVGDGWTDPVRMIPGYPDMLFNQGLISSKEKKIVQEYCDKCVQQIQAGDYFGAFETWDKMLNGDVFPYPNLFFNMTGLKDYDNFYNTEAPSALEYYGPYLSQPNVRRALHVGPRTLQNGKECEKHLLADFHVSLRDELVALLESGVNVLYYSGHLDVIIGTALTERFLEQLEWSGAEEYRASERVVWRVDPHDVDVAGWARSARNFHFVTVKNAGHLVPFDQPRASRNMIDHLINRIPYKNQPNRA